MRFMKIKKDDNRFTIINLSQILFIDIDKEQYKITFRTSDMHSIEFTTGGGEEEEFNRAVSEIEKITINCMHPMLSIVE